MLVKHEESRWTRLVQMIRGWFAQRKAHSSERQEISRRGFFQATTALLVSSRVRWTPRAIKSGIISEYLSSSEGRMRLAMSMMQPLRTRLDYHAISQKAFPIQQLPPGALLVYARDPDVANLVTDEES